MRRTSASSQSVRLSLSALLCSPFVCLFLLLFPKAWPGNAVLAFAINASSLPSRIPRRFSASPLRRVDIWPPSFAFGIHLGHMHLVPVLPLTHCLSLSPSEDGTLSFAYSVPAAEEAQLDQIKVQLRALAQNSTQNGTASFEADSDFSVTPDEVSGFSASCLHWLSVAPFSPSSLIPRAPHPGHVLILCAPPSLRAALSAASLPPCKSATSAPADARQVRRERVDAYSERHRGTASHTGSAGHRTTDTNGWQQPCALLTRSHLSHHASFSLLPSLFFSLFSPSLPFPPSLSPLSGGLLVPLIAGGLALVALTLAAVAAVLYVRRRRAGHKLPTSEAEADHADQVHAANMAFVKPSGAEGEQWTLNVPVVCC